MTDAKYLSDAQVQEYMEYGVLVVDGLLSGEEVACSLDGLKETLRQHGVEALAVDDEVSARAFSKLSSTNGSGGVLDLFYEEWKFEISTNSKLFAMTRQLWAAAYCHDGETKHQLAQDELYRWHPFGSFDCSRGYAYIDRVGYRLPSDLAQHMGDRLRPERKKKARAVQRSLTPHLDCCPSSMYHDSPKWRPIQCFVSLSDSLEPNHGGFEAAKGFHREFDAWAATRPPGRTTYGNSDGSIHEIKAEEAPCVGQYTHIRPKEDREVMDRVQHIPVQAGSAVFWDNRIPHANSYKHLGKHPRAVIYCSFLPDIELNRKYVQQQLADFQQGKPPRDQWNNLEQEYLLADKVGSCLASLSPLGRKLLGMEPWDEDKGDEEPESTEVMLS
jgi:hypothetical protein